MPTRQRSHLSRVQSTEARTKTRLKLSHGVSNLRRSGGEETRPPPDRSAIRPALDDEPLRVAVRRKLPAHHRTGAAVLGAHHITHVGALAALVRHRRRILVAVKARLGRNALEGGSAVSV